MSEMKKIVEAITGRLDTAEKKTDVLQDIATESFQIKKGQKKMSISELWDNFK